RRHPPPRDGRPADGDRVAPAASRGRSRARADPGCRARRVSVAAVVLAAGTSSRYRAEDGSVPSKLVAELDGVPLVRHVAMAALRSRAHPVLVVTGHAQAEV